MNSKFVGLLAIAVLMLGAAGCGGSDQPPGPAGEPAAASQQAEPAAASAKSGLQKIGDMLDAWNEL